MFLRKLRRFFVSLLLIVSMVISPLVSCEEDTPSLQPDYYTAEMRFEAYHFGYTTGRITLTDGVPCELDIGYYPLGHVFVYAYLNIYGHIGDIKSEYESYRFLKTGNRREFANSVSYTVTRDGKTHNQAFLGNNYFLLEALYEGGTRILAPEIGVHCLSYKVPALPEYGLQAMEFEVRLNVKEDTRAVNDAVIKIQNTQDILYSATASQTDGYDLFIMKKAPRFVAQDKITSEILAHDTGLGNPVSGKLEAKYVYIREDRVIHIASDYGFHLVQLLFWDSQTHRNLVYYCYIWIMS